MKFIITNDDGIEAQGIATLHRVLRDGWFGGRIAVTEIPLEIAP